MKRVLCMLICIIMLITFTLTYVVYGEIYIRPVKSLEWYMEVQAGGTSRVAETMKNTWGNTQLVFNGSTGFHYYF